MSRSTDIDQQFNALDELILAEIQSLFEKMARPADSEELQASVTSLNELLQAYNLKEELVRRLVDSATPEDERNAIRELLASQLQFLHQHKQVNADLHSRSPQLIEESKDLIARAQERLERQRQTASDYALEDCAWCRGTAYAAEGPCQACNGRGKVRVYQPSRQCPHCNGDGKASEADKRVYLSPRCSMCQGAGWALIVDE